MGKRETAPSAEKREWELRMGAMGGKEQHKDVRCRPFKGEGRQMKSFILGHGTNFIIKHGAKRYLETLVT